MLQIGCESSFSHVLYIEKPLLLLLSIAKWRCSEKKPNNNSTAANKDGNSSYVMCNKGEPSHRSLQSS